MGGWGHFLNSFDGPRVLGPLGPLVQGPWGPFLICFLSFSKHFVLYCIAYCPAYCIAYCIAYCLDGENGMTKIPPLHSCVTVPWGLLFLAPWAHGPMVQGPWGPWDPYLIFVNTCFNRFQKLCLCIAY